MFSGVRKGALGTNGLLTTTTIVSVIKLMTRLCEVNPLGSGLQGEGGIAGGG